MEYYISEIVFMALIMTSAISIVAATWVIKGTATEETDY